MCLFYCVRVSIMLPDEVQLCRSRQEGLIETIWQRLSRKLEVNSTHLIETTRLHIVRQSKEFSLNRLRKHAPTQYMVLKDTFTFTFLFLIDFHFIVLVFAYLFLIELFFVFILFIFLFFVCLNVFAFFGFLYAFCLLIAHLFFVFACLFLFEL